MSKKLKVALLMGGSSSEREISLASGREVLSHLDKERYEVEVFDPVSDLSRLATRASDFDLAFPVLHGLNGEDGTVQGFLTMLKLPFVGSGILASAQSINKKVTKDVYRLNNLPVAPDLFFCRDQPIQTQLISDKLNFPVVVKPLEEGSSVGLRVVNSMAEAVEALDLVRAMKSDILVEKYLPGRELTCAVVGNKNPEALPPIEIIPGEGHKFFVYSAKYEAGQAREICPADLSPQLTQKISQLAVLAHQVLNCRGISRTDFILSGDGFYLLETNTMPGMTTASLVPKAAAAAGMSFAELLNRLIELAFEEG